MKLYKLYNDIIIEEVNIIKNKLLTEGVLEDLKHAMENTYNVWFKYKSEDGTITDRYVQLDKLGTSLANNQIVRLWQIGGKTTNSKNKSKINELDDLEDVDKTDLEDTNNTNLDDTEDELEPKVDNDLDNKANIDNLEDKNIINKSGEKILKPTPSVNNNNNNVDNLSLTNSTDTDVVKNDKVNTKVNGNVSNKNVWGWKTFRLDRIIPGSIKPTKMKYSKPIKDPDAPYNPYGDKLMKGNITVANYKSK